MHLSGVLFFPVTPFGAGGGLAEDVLAEHISRGLEHGPGGIFVACGTGEFTSLSQDEHARAVRVATETAAGRVPVIAGAGGPLGAALAQAAAAKDAGADGLLLMPPYLAQGPVSGLVAYVRAVAEAGLPVIVYQRGPVVLEPETAVELARIPGVVGLKDGVGDIDRMQRIVLAIRAEIGPEFTFFNGLPTAELTMPAYRGLGVELYSSAVFCFAPEIATAYLRGEERLLTEFYAPLVALRAKVPGYAVSLVKAGVRLRGLDVGPVRPPLTEPALEHLEELSRLLKSGLEIVGAA
ncbi:5-dehydro-4-deoxyglucarate dehydratase [Thermocatellispora tengchongensis]|uniref:Probable 5-dehydro-4-deoxyglucarate dehydratase n=1 Tax=Thermocatellispora tengchongensis TaxID=1073253 RepID=A0A840P5I8_9ACTN|nr:5-dehydro-4-deoxyglucarate dehydratase [Thermocatellispora tengchongensis]MBB5133173.1 5-dehydro-4-deoxyglucarate dehydratase [Thermocatellispora tengchongensis]